MADEYIGKRLFNDAIREAVRRYPNTFYNGLETARQIAHDLPSADVAPVRHGRWELEENWETGYGVYVHVCTACNAITPVNVSRYKYCPNCGCLMDLEVANER